MENSTDIQVCVPKSYFIEPPLSEISFGCGASYKGVLKAEGYLSFVLGIISIVVLTAVIVTYSIFAKLRNLPGLNMMCLTLSLCFGELIFIISGSIDNSSDIICPIVGVFLHFIFLASFFWMNVMSYDVFKTFANKCILTRVRRTKKHFPMYSLYAWGSPALIVGICSIIDFTKCIPKFRIGYGGSSGSSYEYYTDDSFSNQTDNPTIIKLYRQKFGCWIQEPVAALVAFGLPMIVILLANAIMFIRTIICIRSVTKMVSLRTRRSSVSNAIGQHDVILYVRMSTVMGFTWIFGLASSIISSFSEKPTNTVCIVLHVVGVFFIIFNCSQGLFIFFVFVFNRRVGALYKELFGQCRGHLSRQSSASSSWHSVGTIQTIDENTNF
ncbi:probable G-protein coupled receptor Mth-like 2 [Mytilus californianus]|uniref:probable G-protein coupled receptor Mth-like 2 n=1 Tax=Mytilus californianus TaxID=6549 RepID=UPI0022479493|nr:probable G-protein coupled receptor Mth-like 2 [Mytilus californianus]